MSYGPPRRGREGFALPDGVTPRSRSKLEKRYALEARWLLQSLEKAATQLEQGSGTDQDREAAMATVHRMRQAEHPFVETAQAQRTEVVTALNAAVLEYRRLEPRNGQCPDEWFEESWHLPAIEWKRSLLRHVAYQAYMDISFVFPIAEVAGEELREATTRYLERAVAGRGARIDELLAAVCAAAGLPNVQLDSLTRMRKKIAADLRAKKAGKPRGD